MKKGQHRKQLGIKKITLLLKLFDAYGLEGWKLSTKKTQDIFKSVGIVPPNYQHVVLSDLVRKGYIKTTKDKVDKRVKVYQLTNNPAALFSVNLEEIQELAKLVTIHNYIMEKIKNIIRANRYLAYVHNHHLITLRINKLS